MLIDDRAIEQSVYRKKGLLQPLEEDPKKLKNIKSPCSDPVTDHSELEKIEKKVRRDSSESQQTGDNYSTQEIQSVHDIVDRIDEQVEYLTRKTSDNILHHISQFQLTLSTMSLSQRAQILGNLMNFSK